MVEFSPKLSADERLCAGVVIRTSDGLISYICAVDSRKMEHAFGPAGVAFFDVADQLCRSLAEHWAQGGRAEDWRPPFNNARLARLEEFSGRSSQEAMQLFLDRTSSLNSLLGAYEVEHSLHRSSIVAKVQSAIKKDNNSKYLARRFNKHLTVAGGAQPLKVDFLGQRYACYFLKITNSVRGLEANTERAFGKLFELDAVRRLVKTPQTNIGLLEDERPEVFELLMVGDRHDSIQRRAIYQIEALADKNEVVARVEASAIEAAERLTAQERLAA